MSGEGVSSSGAAKAHVGLVLVSHSGRLVEGLNEMLDQLTQGQVHVTLAGGAEDGSLGTDAVAIRDAIERASSGAGVLVLMDLGSAVMGTEAALELVAQPLRDRVRLADAPLVEGAVAAVVEASMGGDLQAVAGAAEAARTQTKLGGAG